MENNYYTNTTPLCRWHHNSNIIGHCTNCGAFICEKCSLPTPDGRRLCPDCFQAEYAHILKETSRMKASAIVLTILGVVSTIFMYILSYNLFLKEHNLITSNLDANMIITTFQTAANGSVLIIALYTLLLFLSIFCSIGFFFGLRKVINKIRTFSVFFIVISVLFFVITFALILQIAWLIGGFVMIHEYIKIHNNKKVLNKMNETYNFFRSNI